MQRRTYFCSCVAAILLSQLSMTALGSGATQTPVPQIKESNLAKTPIHDGPLTFTITEFKAISVFSAHAAWIKMTVENTSSSFVTFSPAILAIVGRDGTQVNVFGIPLPDDQVLPAPDIDLTPKSHVKTFYLLTDRSEIPAKLYYDQQLIAEIVK